jgi:E1A/CREB-binding protein
VVRLNRLTHYMAPTRDPDPIMQCDLMDGRDAFLSMARDKHWEFSTLRRAKYSTMAMLYELHTQGSNGGFVYTCNVCKTPVETRWHCSTCDVRAFFLFPYFVKECRS